MLETAVHQVLGRLRSGRCVIERDHAGNRRITRARASNDVFAVFDTIIEEINRNPGKNHPVEFRPAPSRLQSVVQILENNPLLLEIGVACEALEN